MNFLYLFRGYCEYVLKNESCAALISNIKTIAPIRNIQLINDKEFKFICFFDNVKTVNKIIEQHNIEIVSQKKYGIPYLLTRYKKRIGLILGVVIICAFVVFSQSFIWEISVEGNDKISDDDVKETLRAIGFKEGVYKDSVDIDSIVNNFLINEKRISWISVNFDGTIAHIEVREGINPKINERKKNVNLIASHDGIIMRADVIEGGTLVKKGDVVHKNQLIVSAFIDRENKSSLRGAKGSVWAYTERTICVYVPLKYNDTVVTGDNEINLSVTVLGKNLDIYNRTPSFNKYNTLIKRYKSINNGKYKLPFSVNVRCETECRMISRSRNEQEAATLAEKIADERIVELSPTFTVAEKSYKYVIEDDILIFTCYFSGIEDIAKELEFELS